jgi:hypothetical protein
MKESKILKGSFEFVTDGFENVVMRRLGGWRIRDFFRSIKSLIYWFPVIWQDRHWDDSFIFKVLKHKLIAQSKYIGARDIHIGAKRDAQIMMTCVRLIDKVKDEWYAMEYMDYHTSKVWFIDIPDKPGYSSMESYITEERFDQYFAKYPRVHKMVLAVKSPYRIKGREDDKEIIAMAISKINHDRANRLLFKILEGNIKSWWD